MGDKKLIQVSRKNKRTDIGQNILTSLEFLAREAETQGDQALHKALRNTIILANSRTNHEILEDAVAMETQMIHDFLSIYEQMTPDEKTVALELIDHVEEAY